MGCSSCSSGGGTPRGCKNNGTCSSGGCSKLEVYDWLANMALPNGQAPYDIVEVRFKNSRKGFFRNAKGFSLQVGDVVVVEASPGHDVGVVSVVGELARIQVKKKEPNLKPMEAKKIYRIAAQADVDKWIEARSLEKDLMYKSRVLATNLSMEMKISDVEYQGDLSKATFYYTAEGRVDFRQLIKDMADQFKVRVEMRQVGSRQEASRLGGIGSCGRELCCSTWLTDFRSVSTSAARYQQLSLNPQKLAGQCGKLKCCLNFELDMYIDALNTFPKSDTRLRTEKGSAIHIKTDVFKRQMWFVYEGDAGTGLIPLAPERVREIMAMNAGGKKPLDLAEFVEKVIEKVPDYTNLVGQESLNRFEHIFKGNKKKKKKSTKPKAEGSNVVANTASPEAKPAQKPRPRPNPRPAQASDETSGEVKPKPKSNRSKNWKNKPKPRGGDNKPTNNEGNA
jgi:cell fate regulator YaaT (PSP1 superfamily)